MIPILDETGKISLAIVRLYGRDNNLPEAHCIAVCVWQRTSPVGTNILKLMKLLVGLITSDGILNL